MNGLCGVSEPTSAPRSLGLPRRPYNNDGDEVMSFPLNGETFTMTAIRYSADQRANTN
jgi:hypothetical protein